MATKNKEDFVHLHCHSDQSQLDGCAKIESYVKAAAERGNPAIALTDHGTLRGAFELTEKCNEQGIKPIYGIEFYVCPDMRRRGFTDEEKAEITKGVTAKTKQKELLKAAEDREGIRRTYHITAWALDNEGLKNLYRLSSKSWAEGYYYRPRIDLDALCEHQKGLAVGTGCAGSVIYGQRWEGRMKELDLALGQLCDTFGDRMYLEIMPHDLDEGRQADANQFACDIRELTGGKHEFLATQDAHYLKKTDAVHHEVLLAIGTRGSMKGDRFKFDGEQYWLKTREEMERGFRGYHDYLGDDIVGAALQNTVEFAERSTAKIEIDPLKCLLPPVDIPEEFGEDEFAYLKHLVMRGVAMRDLHGRSARLAKREGIKAKLALKRYTQRIASELDVLRKSGFARYFLILHDLYCWAGGQGIATGPGRGSAAGSIVSYLIGLTHVDPIEHRLMFERFIAPGRINMPDIDCFPAGTLVWTDLGQEPIENVKPGALVHTRRGMKRVTHRHKRWTRPGEGLIEITLSAGTRVVRLTCTPAHPIFQNREGNVEAVKAGQCEVGQRVICLPELWEAVSEEVSQSPSVLAKMWEAAVPFGRGTVLPGMRETISRAAPSKDLFSSMWVEGVGAEDVLARQRRVSIRLGALCSFFAGSRLRKGVADSWDKISIRTGDLCARRRDELHAGLRSWPDIDRVERMARARCGEAADGTEALGHSAADSVLRRSVGGTTNVDQARKGAGRELRAVSREVLGFQDEEKNLPDLRRRVRDAGDAGLQDVQHCVPQHSADARAGRERGRGADRDQVFDVRQDVPSLSPSEHEGFLFNEMYERSTEAEIVYVRRIEADCIVYDLTVEDDHEYVAGGVLVHNCDFEDARRGEIVEYLKRRYGEDRVAQISTSGRMQGRQVVKDVARVFEVPYQRAAAATAVIDSTEDDEAIKTALDSSELFREFAKVYPDVVDHALALEGLTKSSGLHAAGVVTSPVPLTEVIPLEVRRPPGGEQIVTAFDMRGVEGMGLLKIDVLGLKAVTMLHNAEVAVAEKTGKPFRLLDVSIEDRKTLKAFTARDFIGVFQFDSPSANAICEGLEFDCFDDIAVVNSINRPGALAFADEYKRRRKEPELAQRHVFHPKVTEITRDALGLMIYQEHVIRVCTDVAGMDPSAADKLRKKIGKSEGHEALEKDRDVFVKGCARRTVDMDEDTANRLFDSIVKFGRYGFNRCVDIGTKVSTMRGDRPICSLRPGDVVLGTSDGVLSLQKVLRVWPQEILERIYLEFDDGSDVVCTLEHRWLTDDGVKTTKEIIERGWAVAQVRRVDSPMRKEVKDATGYVYSPKTLPRLWEVEETCGRSLGLGGPMRGEVQDEERSSMPSVWMRVLQGARRSREAIARLAVFVRTVVSCEVGKVGSLVGLCGVQATVDRTAFERAKKTVGGFGSNSQVQSSQFNDRKTDIGSLGNTGRSGGKTAAVARAKPGGVTGDCQAKLYTLYQAFCFTVRRNGLGGVGSTAVSTQCTGKMWEGCAPSRLCGAVSCRDRWSSSFQADLRGGEIQDRKGARCDFERVDQRKREGACSGFDGLFYYAGPIEAVLGNDSPAKPESSRDRAYAYRRLVRWRKLGLGPVVDIEVEGDHLFALANGLVSHNSHAVCYSLLGYWTMYLKVHHPLEFYWAMMQRESDRKKLQRLARDAEHHDIKTLLPDVNVSGADFVIDRAADAIRGSLLDISGIGEAAVRAIEEVRADKPFASLVDFFERARGRAVTKRTMQALVKSGALDAFIPNPRWWCWEFTRMWKHVDAKRWGEVEKQTEESKKKDQWTHDERMKEASEVNPLAMRAHPCITWESFLTHEVRPELQEINETMLAKKQEVFCAGLVTEMEQRMVGDSKSFDEMPSEEVRKRIGWGEPWIRFTVEGLEGKAWVKLDWRQYQYFRRIHESGTGAAVMMCAETRPDYSNLHVHFLADVEEVAQKMKDGEKLTIWERLFVDHPSLRYPWKTKADKKVAMSNPQKIAENADGWFRVIGVVSHLYENVDRRGQTMAWFGIAGVTGYQRVICFGSSWSAFNETIRPGRLVGVTLRKMEDGGACLEARPRAVVVYRKEEAVPPPPPEESTEQEEGRAGELKYDDDIPF